MFEFIQMYRNYTNYIIFYSRKDIFVELNFQTIKRYFQWFVGRLQIQINFMTQINDRFSDIFGEIESISKTIRNKNVFNLIKWY